MSLLSSYGRWEASVGCLLFAIQIWRKGPPLFQEGLRKLTIFMVFLTLFVKHSITFRALVAHFQCIRTLLETTFEQGPFRC